jgi:hypothetical protein
MTDAWDGRPQNPERDGWHWLCAAVGTGAPYPMLWSADGKAWDTGDGWIFCTDPALIERRRYLGPCLTPAEITAREAASAEAMREAWKAAAQKEIGGAEAILAVPNLTEAAKRETQSWRDGAHALLRAAYAEHLPHASALARAEKAAYQRGWNDRESDFLTGVERTGMAVVGPDALAAAEKRGMERAAQAASDAAAEHFSGEGELYIAKVMLDAIRNAAAQEIVHDPR